VKYSSAPRTQLVHSDPATAQESAVFSTNSIAADLAYKFGATYLSDEPGS